MTETKLPEEVEKSIKKASEYICEITSDRLHPNDFRDELRAIAVTATQQAVESERSRLQIKTAVNIMLTRLTPDECTEVMEKIYPEGIVIRPEEREALSHK